MRWRKSSPRPDASAWRITEIQRRRAQALDDLADVTVRRSETQLNAMLDRALFLDDVIGTVAKSAGPVPVQEESISPRQSLPDIAVYSVGSMFAKECFDHL